MSANQHESGKKPHSMPYNAPRGLWKAARGILGRSLANALLRKLWAVLLGTNENSEHPGTLWSCVIDALRVLKESGFGLW